jgi:hypothetical protein
MELHKCLEKKFPKLCINFHRSILRQSSHLERGVALQTNLLFDKAVFVILEEPEFEDYKRLQT